MEVTFTIDDEDEELTLEGFLDKKMEDVHLSQAESVYTLACSCLQDRKNQRPFSKQVGRGRRDTLACSPSHQNSLEVGPLGEVLTLDLLPAGSVGAERNCQKHFWTLMCSSDSSLRRSQFTPTHKK